MLQFEGYTLDIARNLLRAADREIALRRKSFELLRYLVENPDRLVTREELLKAIWPHVVVTEESLTRCVSEVRQAIGDNKQTIIATVPRCGYRFAVPVVRVANAGEAPPLPCPAPSPVAGEGRGSRDYGPTVLHSPTSTLDPSPQARGELGKAGAPSGSSNSGPQLPPYLPAHAGESRGDRRSIAVLPFANLGGEGQQDYFSDGITEDITTELSRFSELIVIARNSSFQYKGKAVDIRQIGQELGARYVLEGSVRRSGDRIRITAQLIDTATGAHR